MKKKIGIAIVAFLLIGALFFPYLKAEYLTRKYGEQFEGLELETHMLNAARYHKVLSYSEEEAEVFYVSGTGDLITFEKTDGGWHQKEWKTIWSTSGSADGFYWPYYR